MIVPSILTLWPSSYFYGDDCPLHPHIVTIIMFCHHDHDCPIHLCVAPVCFAVWHPIQFIWSKIQKMHCILPIMIPCDYWLIVTTLIFILPDTEEDTNSNFWSKLSYIYILNTWLSLSETYSGRKNQWFVNRWDLTWMSFKLSKAPEITRRQLQLPPTEASKSNTDYISIISHHCSRGDSSIIICVSCRAT